MKEQEISINGEVVKVALVERVVPPRGDSAEFRHMIKRYSFSAMSTEAIEDTEADEDWVFYESEIERDEALRGDRSTLCSSLIYNLSTCGDWDITGVRTDMWGAMSLRNYNTSEEMSIMFDYFEHGLLAAYLIAKQLNPESFED